MMAYSPLPVMTTKIRIKDVHANTPLRSDRGETYRVTSQDGLQTISSTLPFSLTARHSELRQKGCSSFVIDLSDESRERWGEIMTAFKSGRELPGTTEFNYPAELI
jgi:U32 family peptidase